MLISQAFDRIFTQIKNNLGEVDKSNEIAGIITAAPDEKFDIKMSTFILKQLAIILEHPFEISDPIELDSFLSEMSEKFSQYAKKHSINCPHCSSSVAGYNVLYAFFTLYALSRGLEKAFGIPDAIIIEIYSLSSHLDRTGKKTKSGFSAEELCQRLKKIDVTKGFK